MIVVVIAFLGFLLYGWSEWKRCVAAMPTDEERIKNQSILLERLKEQDNRDRYMREFKKKKEAVYLKWRENRAQTNAKRTFDKKQ